MLVRELVDGQEIDQALLVRRSELRSRRDGGDYLKLSLGDRTGCVSATIGEHVAELAGSCEPGCVVRVAGRFSVSPRYGPQLDVRALRAAGDDE